jgi:hypothetical protein
MLDRSDAAKTAEKARKFGFPPAAFRTAKKISAIDAVTISSDRRPSQLRGATLVSEMAARS